MNKTIEEYRILKAKYGSPIEDNPYGYKKAREKEKEIEKFWLEKLKEERLQGFIEGADLTGNIAEEELAIKLAEQKKELRKKIEGLKLNDELNNERAIGYDRALDQVIKQLT